MNQQIDTILHGKCLDILRTYPDNFFDSIVTDPPYGLGDHDPTLEEIIAYLQGADLEVGEFMNKDWDLPSVIVWKECWRVLKPGGFLFSFAGTRTIDILSIGIRVAGFTNRDTIDCEMGPPILRWLRAQGMPKNVDVGKVTRIRVEGRYGKKVCCCTQEEAQDTLVQVGSATRDSIRCKSSEDGGVQRGVSKETSLEVGGSNLSVQTVPQDCSLRELQDPSCETSKVHETLQTSLLLKGLPQRSPTEEGSGDSSIWEGLEEDKGRGSKKGPSLRGLRKDSKSKRGSSSCSPSETLSVPRDQSIEELGLPLRELSPHLGINHHEGSGLDSDRCDSRRVTLDSYVDGKDPVARVCSWCGLPDQDWLASLQGLGTALKPYWEPILVFRKPLAETTLAGQVLVTGTGGINIEASRIKHSSLADFAKHKAGVDAIKARGGKMGNSWKNSSDLSGANDVSNSGRLPPNVIFVHSDLCRKVGTQTVPMPPINRFDDGAKPFGGGAGHEYTTHHREDETLDVWECHPSCPIHHLNQQHQVPDGGAAKYFLNVDPGSMFFYVPKPSLKEKSHGLEEGEENEHDTVKPVRLMEYLVRMATPPKGIVLDPYCGSGTTCVAAANEGFKFLGIEKEGPSVKTALARIDVAINARKELAAQTQGVNLMYSLESE